jgi:hypothetical protein
MFLLFFPSFDRVALFVAAIYFSIGFIFSIGLIVFVCRFGSIPRQYTQISNKLKFLWFRRLPHVAHVMLTATVLWPLFVLILRCAPTTLGRDFKQSLISPHNPESFLDFLVRMVADSLS